MSLKDFYYNLEDKYYSFLEKIDKKVKILPFIDAIDKVIPSFILVLIFCFLFFALIIFLIIYFSLSSNAVIIKFMQNNELYQNNFSLVIIASDKNYNYEVSNGVLETSDFSVGDLVTLKIDIYNFSKTLKLEKENIIDLPSSLEEVLESSENTKEYTLYFFDSSNNPIEKEVSYSVKCSSFEDSGTAVVSVTIETPKECNSLSVHLEADSYLPLDDVCNNLYCPLNMTGLSSADFTDSEESSIVSNDLYVYVKDSEGNFLDNADVKILDIEDSSNVIDESYTNDIGKASFYDLKEGSYTLFVQDENNLYMSHTEDFNISGGPAKVINVVLSKEPLGYLRINLDTEDNEKIEASLYVYDENNNAVFISDVNTGEVQSIAMGKTGIFSIQAYPYDSNYAEVIEAVDFSGEDKEINMIIKKYDESDYTYVDLNVYKEYKGNKEPLQTAFKILYYDSYYGNYFIYSDNSINKETNENGFASILLPKGTYNIEINNDFYEGETGDFDLEEHDKVLEIPHISKEINVSVSSSKINFSAKVCSSSNCISEDSFSVDIYSNGNKIISLSEEDPKEIDLEKGKTYAFIAHKDAYLDYAIGPVFLDKDNYNYEFIFYSVVSYGIGEISLERRGVYSDSALSEEISNISTGEDFFVSYDIIVPGVLNGSETYSELSYVIYTDTFNESNEKIESAIDLIDVYGYTILPEPSNNNDADNYRKYVMPLNDIDEPTVFNVVVHYRTNTHFSDFSEIPANTKVFLHFDVNAKTVDNNISKVEDVFDFLLGGEYYCNDNICLSAVVNSIPQDASTINLQANTNNVKVDVKTGNISSYSYVYISDSNYEFSDSDTLSDFIENKDSILDVYDSKYYINDSEILSNDWPVNTQDNVSSNNIRFLDLNTILITDKIGYLYYILKNDSEFIYNKLSLEPEGKDFIINGLPEFLFPGKDANISVSLIDKDSEQEIDDYGVKIYVWNNNKWDYSLSENISGNGEINIGADLLKNGSAVKLVFIKDAYKSKQAIIPVQYNVLSDIIVPDEISIKYPSEMPKFFTIDLNNNSAAPLDINFIFKTDDKVLQNVLDLNKMNSTRKIDPGNNKITFDLKYKEESNETFDNLNSSKDANFYILFNIPGEGNAFTLDISKNIKVHLGYDSEPDNKENCLSFDIIDSTNTSIMNNNNVDISFLESEKYLEYSLKIVNECKKDGKDIKLEDIVLDVNVGGGKAHNIEISNETANEVIDLSQEENKIIIANFNENILTGGSNPIILNMKIRALDTVVNPTTSFTFSLIGKYKKSDSKGLGTFDSGNAITLNIQRKRLNQCLKLYLDDSKYNDEQLKYIYGSYDGNIFFNLPYEYEKITKNVIEGKSGRNFLNKFFNPGDEIDLNINKDGEDISVNDFKNEEYDEYNYLVKDLYFVIKNNCGRKIDGLGFLNENFDLDAGKKREFVVNKNTEAIKNNLGTILYLTQDGKKIKFIGINNQQGNYFVKDAFVLEGSTVIPSLKAYFNTVLSQFDSFLSYMPKKFVKDTYTCKSSDPENCAYEKYNFLRLYSTYNSKIAIQAKGIDDDLNLSNKLYSEESYKINNFNDLSGSFVKPYFGPESPFNYNGNLQYLLLFSDEVRTDNLSKAQAYLIDSLFYDANFDFSDLKLLYKQIKSIIDEDGSYDVYNINLPQFEIESKQSIFYNKVFDKLKDEVNSKGGFKKYPIFVNAAVANVENGKKSDVVYAYTFCPPDYDIYKIYLSRGRKIIEPNSMQNYLNIWKKDDGYTYISYGGAVDTYNEEKNESGAYVLFTACISTDAEIKRNYRFIDDNTAITRYNPDLINANYDDFEKCPFGGSTGANQVPKMYQSIAGDNNACILDSSGNFSKVCDASEFAYLVDKGYIKNGDKIALSYDDYSKKELFFNNQNYTIVDVSGTEIKYLPPGVYEYNKDNDKNITLYFYKNILPFHAFYYMPKDSITLDSIVEIDDSSYSSFSIAEGTPDYFVQSYNLSKLNSDSYGTVLELDRDHNIFYWNSLDVFILKLSLNGEEEKTVSFKSNAFKKDDDLSFLTKAWFSVKDNGIALASNSLVDVIYNPNDKSFTFKNKSNENLDIYRVLFLPKGSSLKIDGNSFKSEISISNISELFDNIKNEYVCYYKSGSNYRYYISYSQILKNKEKTN